MIKELEENRRSSPFISSKIGTYCFIYLICKTLKQEKPHVLDISRLISNLDASDVEKEILSRHIINFPEGFEISDFERYSIKRIENYFKSFRLYHMRRYDAMYSKENMCYLGALMLCLNQNDRLADFYGDPEGFIIFALNNTLGDYNFDENPVCYTKDPILRDFLILFNNVVYEKSNIDILVKDVFREEKKFNKIYSVIPNFKNSTLEETRRWELNVINAEDDTSRYVKNVLAHMDENGRAVMWISDILFSEKKKDLRKYLCDSGCFCGLIRFPAGEIFPSGLSSSLLIFDRNKKNDDFIFLDLCNYENIEQNKSIIGQIGVYPIKSMFDGISEPISDSIKREIRSYKVLDEKGFDFEIKKPFNLLEFLENYDPDSEVWDPPEPPLKLSENVTISRGVQDTDNIRSFETFNDDALYFYLNVSDIQNGQIQYDNMKKLASKKENWDKYFLQPGDVLITKTAYPAFKIAIFEGEGNRVIPASNLFIIRMNYGDSCNLNPYYLKLYLESDLGLKYLKSVASGSKLPAISKENLERLTLPYKSEDEQKEIEQTYKDILKKIKRHQREIDILEEKMKKIIG